jgi:peptidoglycan/LPS O-acetylase OafA/YrhL
MPESQYQGQGTASAMAAAWLSNIYFTFSDVDYFAEKNTSNAVLHTWSLGIEEQFYLL